MAKNHTLTLAMGLLLFSAAAWSARPPGLKPDCTANVVLTELQPLQFGTFVADLGGTVTIDPLTGLRSAAGVTLIASDAGQPAIIELSMPPDYPADCSLYQVNITLPASFVITSGGQTMTVAPVTSFPASRDGALGIDNAPLRVYVGGTATAVTGQPAGLYTGSYTIDMVFR